MSINAAFWNNKGGTGKTSLAFQIICDFAHENPKKKILANGRVPTSESLGTASGWA